MLQKNLQKEISDIHMKMEEMPQSKKKRNLMNAVIIGVFLIDETSDIKDINYVANNKEGRIFTFQ